MARVLLIDDEEPIRTVLQALLELDGHVVSVATGGTDGLEQCERSRPDVVLVDLLMPALSGIATIEKLRSMQPDLGIVAISGCIGSDPDEPSLGMALRCGATATLEKPFGRQALREVLEHMGWSSS